MKLWIVTIIALMAMTTFALAQTGTVSGTVFNADNDPVEGAYVHLTGDGWHGGGHHGGGHHHGDNYFAETDADGNFEILDVEPDVYIAMASKMGEGHDSEEIEVLPGENTEVEFVLEMGGHGGGGYHCDSLEIVELSGWAIVEDDDYYTHYFLDTENDGEADYRLSFGPEWYDPGSGAERPEDGDSIWVVGGLMGYSRPQTVVVYEINGLFWREPGDGHGGHGGHGGDGGCNPDSLDLVEVDGIAIVEGMHGMEMYYLDEDFDESADYHLNFGAPWYDPGNGAARPDDGDSVSIVGGQMEGCMGLPVIIVYEINGEFWREPGDTTGLWIEPTAVDESEENLLPEKYIRARNYPNPFNPSTTIAFELVRDEHVRITVYDLLGRKVATLADRRFPSGENEVGFDPGETRGSGSAVYFYRIETEAATASGKMIMVK